MSILSKYFLLAAVQLLYINDTLPIYLLKCSLKTDKSPYTYESGQITRKEYGKPHE